MFHEDKTHIGDGSKYWKGWRGVYAPTAGELANLATEYAISPCMWGGGIRKKANFRYAEWLGLDFDEVVTLDDAQKSFEKHLYVIGTTKSHQKEKNGVVCDRFRVFLRFGDRCVSAEDYEATARKFVRRYGADPACVDAARFFWPCQDVVAFKWWGKIINAVDSALEKKKMEKAAEKRKQSWASLYPKGNIPIRVQNKLKFGVPKGRRNIACFGIGADLASQGFSKEEIMSLIQNSPILANDFTLSEAEKAVISGMKKITEGDL